MAKELAELTVEQRLAALEKEVALLKMQLNQLTSPKGNWIEQISGSAKNLPAFAEAMRLGREIRQADRPPDDEP